MYSIYCKEIVQILFTVLSSILLILDYPFVRLLYFDKGSQYNEIQFVKCTILLNRDMYKIKRGHTLLHCCKYIFQQTRVNYFCNVF